MGGIIERLHDRIAELEGILGVSIEVARRYKVLGLAPMSCRVLGYIVSREIANRDGLYAAIYGGRPECEQPDIKVLDQQIWRVRRRLEPHGIEIRMEWGVGYSMAPSDKARLQALLINLANS